MGCGAVLLSASGYKQRLAAEAMMQSVDATVQVKRSFGWWDGGAGVLSLALRASKKATLRAGESWGCGRYISYEKKVVREIKRRTTHRDDDEILVL